MNKYYSVSNTQIFLTAILTGIISAAIIKINNSVEDYFKLPVVVLIDNKCISVESTKNGELYTCADVNMILRNYRVKTK